MSWFVTEIYDLMDFLKNLSIFIWQIRFFRYLQAKERNNEVEYKELDIVD